MPGAPVCCDNRAGWLEVADPMTAERNHLLGIDLGAGSLKATSSARDGSLAGEGSHGSVETQTPKFGWSEQDPDEWYQALCRAVPAALQAAGIRPRRPSPASGSPAAPIFRC